MYRIYTLNVATGVATQLGADLALPSAESIGFDFNPQVDLLRLVTDTDLNHRYNPSTGVLVAADTPLDFDPSDTNDGDDPLVAGAAYSNNVPGAASTTLYDIEAGNDVLVTQTPANSGLLFTKGPLGVDFGALAGFDISGGTGVAYASNVGGTLAPQSFLYTINLDTGAATLRGEIGSTLVVNDITAVPVPEPTGLAACALALGLSAVRRRR